MLDSDIAYGKLRTRIVGGQYPAGSAISPRQLADELRVGHMSVRSAVQRLALEGLLTIVPRRGTFVSAPSADALKEIFEVRLALESAAAYFAARNGPTSELRAIADQLRCVVESSSTKVGDEQRIGWNFHEALFRATRNERLLSAYNVLRSQSGLALKELRRKDNRVVRRGTLEHLAIFDKIEARNAGEAQTKMWLHVQGATEARMTILTSTDSQID